MTEADITGRCDNCSNLVTEAEWEERTHPCYPMSISYGLQPIVNPDNTPWVPGYTFHTDQASGARTGHQCRGNNHIRSRVYRVGFEIDYEGHLRHVSGPRPTDETLEALTEAYRRHKPGSNWYPGVDDDMP